MLRAAVDLVASRGADTAPTTDDMTCSVLASASSIDPVGRVSSSPGPTGMDPA